MIFVNRFGFVEYFENIFNGATSEEKKSINIVELYLDFICMHDAFQIFERRFFSEECLKNYISTSVSKLLRSNNNNVISVTSTIPPAIFAATPAPTPTPIKVEEMSSQEAVIPNFSGTLTHFHLYIKLTR